MHPTNMALAAMQLGYDLQLLKWSAFQEQYPEKRRQLEANLMGLGLARELPDSVDNFVTEHDDLFGAIYQHLVQERSRLGGDVYALTMFTLGYLPLELVVSAAWKSENYEPLLVNFKLVLEDLSIAGELEALKRAIDVETQWLAQQSQRNDGQLRSSDALKAAVRLAGRTFSLWTAAEELGLKGAVRFDEVPYHSVFISYSTVDEKFCRSLHDALADAGLRVWFAPHEIRPGQKIHQQVYGAIEKYDKLLIVLSRASMKSEWVGTELYKARERERTEKAQILFPIRLVPFEEIRAWTAFDADSGRDMARELREYYIPDFSGWRDPDVFDGQVRRLIEALVVTEVSNE